MTPNAPYKTDASASSYDYIIAGGGLCGCVIASRLSQAGRSVLLIEAGPDEHINPQIQSPLGAPLLHGTPLEYNYLSTPQKHLNGRQINMYGGKVLSGSSAVNYGLWSRGHSADFDAWAKHVGDPRWSYSGLLKYFRRTEHHHKSDGDSDIHGFEGNIHTVQGPRGYPLAKPLKEAHEQAGFQFNPNANSGNPLGYGAYTENWKNAARQPAGYAYDLSQVTVLTNNFLERVTFHRSSGTPKATGVKLVDGRLFSADKEVMVCCGALRTPQMLMLSGIGPKDQLDAFGIEAVVDAPEVGKNLHDHISAAQWWRLKNPERGLAVGSPNFNNPKYFEGLPVDWISTISADECLLRAARQQDGVAVDQADGESRGDIEIIFLYVPVGDFNNKYGLPMDGSVITSGSLCLLPSSRGRITLASKDPTADSIIDPNYYATEADKAIVRYAMRQTMRIVESPAGQSIFEGEHPPPGFAPLNSKSSDEEIDARVRHVAGTWFHPAGTASMGTVVDSDCRVKGVDGLRVIDASIVPLPIAAHYQASMYAVAEAGADIILNKNSA